MAIALQHHVYAVESANDTSITATGIVPAGTDRYGIVKIGFFSSATINSVVWGGVDITANVIKNAIHDGANRKRHAWFYYLNPPASSADVVVTLSAASFDKLVAVEAWDGVDQTTSYGSLTFDAADGSTYTTVPATLSVSSASGEVVTGTFYQWSGSGVGFDGYGDGTVIDTGAINAGNASQFASLYEAGAATVVLDWDQTNASSSSSMYAISLKPASGGGGASLKGRKTLLGVGL